jgi:hypothetical protein
MQVGGQGNREPLEDATNPTLSWMPLREPQVQRQHAQKLPEQSALNARFLRDRSCERPRRMVLTLSPTLMPPTPEAVTTGKYGLSRYVKCFTCAAAESVAGDVDCTICRIPALCHLKSFALCYYTEMRRSKSSITWIRLPLLKSTNMHWRMDLSLIRWTVYKRIFLLNGVIADGSRVSPDEGRWQVTLCHPVRPCLRRQLFRSDFPVQIS